MRTELTLSLLGKLEDYNAVFRIKDFKLFKNIYLVHIYSIKDPLAKEIREFIKEIDYKVPITVKIAAFITPNILSKQIVIIIPKLRKCKIVAKIINLFLKL